MLRPAMSRIFFTYMSVYFIEKELYFPPVSEAEPDGLVAMGGDLSVERLLLAYKTGIFPWFEGDMPLWWSPDPRFVLFPEELRVSHSMKQLLKQQSFRFSMNTAFDDVISQCKSVARPGQRGTWITRDMKNAYTRLHKLGYAKSAEVWKEDQLVGGLYGVQIGKMFFGESMFSVVSNASKYAFINFVQELVKQQVHLIDCQVYTPHLETFGARMIPRKRFLEYLSNV